MSSQGIQWAASCSGTAADTSVPFGCSIGGTALSVRNRFGAHVSSAVIFMVRSTVCLRQGEVPACLGGVPGTSTSAGIGPVIPLALALREEVLRWRQKEEAATTLVLGTAQRLPVPHTSADNVRASGLLEPEQGHCDRLHHCTFWQTRFSDAQDFCQPT